VSVRAVMEGGAAAEAVLERVRLRSSGRPRRAASPVLDPELAPV
jgi:hypothetical protein